MSDVPLAKPHKPGRLPLPPAPGRSGATDEGELHSGDLIDSRYQVEDLIGEGGAGRVYRAVHLKLGKSIAIKVLRRDDLNNENQRARFEREAMALAGLSHPNIVSVSDYGVYRGRPYIAMEMLHGRTLHDLILQGPLPERDALRITRDLLHALAYAHNEGVVHRDLKPANIFLQSFHTQRDHVKVLDYGFAKFVTNSPLAAAPSLTAAGVTFGTPAYIAPERLGGVEVDGRADLYSVGVLLYEMLTGDRPFVGEMPDVLHAHLTEPVPDLSLRCPGLFASPELRRLLETAMAKTLAERFPDAGAFLDALSALPVPAVYSDRKREGDPEEPLSTALAESARPHASAAGTGRGGVVESLRPMARRVSYRTQARWLRSKAAVRAAWRSSLGFADRASAYTRNRALPRMRAGWHELIARLRGLGKAPKQLPAGESPDTSYLDANHTDEEATVVAADVVEQDAAAGPRGPSPAGSEREDEGSTVVGTLSEEEQRAAASADGGAMASAASAPPVPRASQGPSAAPEPWRSSEPAPSARPSASPVSAEGRSSAPAAADGDAGSSRPSRGTGTLPMPPPSRPVEARTSSLPPPSAGASPRKKGPPKAKGAPKAAAKAKGARLAARAPKGAKKPKS